MVTHGSVAASYSQRVVFLAGGSAVRVPEQPTPTRYWSGCACSAILPRRGGFPATSLGGG